MDFKGTMYILLLLILSINMVVSIANNFVVVDVDDFTGNPVYFSLNNGEDTYTFSKLQATLTNLKFNFQDTISDVSLSSLLSLINAFLSSITSLGNLLINLGTGYMRITEVVLSPLDIVTSASTGYGLGYFIALLVNLVIMALIVIGFFEWLKDIAASVAGAIK